MSTVKSCIGRRRIFTYLNIAFLLLSSLWVSQAIAESYLLDAIEFRGNDTTQDLIMLQEINLVVGEMASDAAIEYSRQSIMDLGLFKRVSADLEARGGKGKSLIITVIEKRYLLILPRLSRSGDGDWSYGAKFQWDNLYGKNRRLQFGYRRKDLKNSDIEQEDRLELEYYLPRLWGSQFNLEYVLRSEDIEIDETRDELSGRYEQKLDSMRIRLSRWLREKGPSQGWLLRSELTYEDYDSDFLSGDEGLFFDTTVASVAISVIYQDVHDKLYSREGKSYGLTVSASESIDGEDVRFSRGEIFYRRYIPITRKPHTNFNYQLRYMTSSGSIFGDASYGLGGNTTLRGYDRDSLEGESAFIANLEFMVPMFGHNTLRGAVFSDIGGAFSESSGFDASELEYSVGLGVRYKLRAFVRTDLRLDVGYGVESGETKVYGSTNTSF